MATPAAEGGAGAPAPAKTAETAAEHTPLSIAESKKTEASPTFPSRGGDSTGSGDTKGVKEIMLSPRSFEYNPARDNKRPLWKRCFQILTERLDVSWSCRQQRKRLDPSACEALRNTYWLSRIVFLRALGFVYFVAFLISFNQAQGLVGSDGILPAKHYAEKTAKELAVATFWEKVKRFPSLFLLLPADDFWIHFLPFLGCLLSLLVILKGGTHASTLLVLWILYQSVVSIGQAWYAFAWEIQLLETGFLSIFVSPFWSCSRLPESWPTPLVAIWGSRWLLFRLLLGSGLTKLRSKSSAWRDFSAFNFFYATQPLPNPFSWYLHNETHALHAMAAVAVLVVECVAGFMVLLPVRSCRLLAACAHLGLQFWWALGGNYAFLTWCSCLPAILCLDDRFLSCLFPMETLRRVETLASLSPVGLSCPITQAWPLCPKKGTTQSGKWEAENGHGDKEGQDAESPMAHTNRCTKGDEAKGLLSTEGEIAPFVGMSGDSALPEFPSGSADASAVGGEIVENRRTCCCWYRPTVERFCRRLGTCAAATWPEVKAALQEKWTGLLGEAVAAVALLLSMQQVAQATPAAVWLVVVVFFLAAGLASSSVFLTRSRFSHVFVETVLLLAALQSAINLYTNSPAVWSVWICCCLFTILLIFAYHVLENAALVFKIQVELLLFLLITALSVPVVKNLLSPEQVMSASSVDGTLNIVNTYGLFGTVAQERYELIVQGTQDPSPSVHSTWFNYEFKCKAGDPYRRPCFLSPYHYRLDWLMWLLPHEAPHLAMRRHPWFLAFLHRLLKNTPSVTKLLATNPFKRSGPPTALRVIKVKYFLSASSRLFGGGPWWVVDTEKTEMFTLPTEIPGAVEHLQEMRESFYRRRVAERQQQLQRQEKERRRLEKKAFEARRKAATAEEKRRKTAAAAAAKVEKARLAAAAPAQHRAAVAVPHGIQKEEHDEVSKEKKGKGAEERKKEKGRQKWLHHKESKEHEENIAQHLTGLVAEQPESKEGAQEKGTGIRAENEDRSIRKLASPDAHRQTEEAAAVKHQQQQQRKQQRETPTTPDTVATAHTKKQHLPTTVGSKEDGGVPLHAAPLLSRRLLKLTRR